MYREQGRQLNAAIKTLLGQLVALFYTNDLDIQEDNELQAFAAEVSRHLRGFPGAIVSRVALTDLLTQTYFTISVEHSSMNFKNPYYYSAVLPQAPFALYRPLPTAKNQIQTEADVMAFLPSLEQSILQIGLAAVFNKPTSDAETLRDSLASIGMGGRASPYIAEFQATLDSLRASIQAAAATEQVLPFILLDPASLPYYGWV